MKHAVMLVAVIIATALATIPSGIIPYGNAADTDIDTSAADTHATAGTDTDTGHGFILVQTSIRNSHGTLLTYLESTKFSYIDYNLLDTFLDHESAGGGDPVIDMGGVTMQVIRRATTQTFDSYDVIASTNLYDSDGRQQSLLARFTHDGYPVHPGDTLQSVWTFVRPV